jgi:transcription antitermination factor NusG
MAVARCVWETSVRVGVTPEAHGPRSEPRQSFAVRLAAVEADDPAAAIGPARRWYVVQTHARKEALAAANLARQGFGLHLPQICRVVHHARRVREVQRPLFPGYLFVALDLALDRWRPVQSTFGVRSIIMDGDRPRAVPRGLVESMIASAGVGYRRELAVGDDVRFLSGPFADRLGRLLEMDDAGRVRVLLDILGAEREVAAEAAVLLPLR